MAKNAAQHRGDQNVGHTRQLRRTRAAGALAGLSTVCPVARIRQSEVDLNSEIPESLHYGYPALEQSKVARRAPIRGLRGIAVDLDLPRGEAATESLIQILVRE